MGREGEGGEIEREGGESEVGRDCGRERERERWGR